jgi:hypothetical protein
MNQFYIAGHGLTFKIIYSKRGFTETQRKRLPQRFAYGAQSTPYQKHAGGTHAVYS